MTNKEYAEKCVEYGVKENIKEALVYVKAMRAYKRMMKKYYGINVTEHTGKLTGFYSISTSSLVNEFCIARSKNPSLICFHCYANNLQKHRSNLQRALIKNSEILTSEILDLPPLPKECDYFRIESFGDLINETQAINYRNFIEKNSHVFFGWWSKNEFILDRIEDFKRPQNCNLISSSEKVNHVKEELPKHFNKRFTVFDKSSDACINCGSRDCGKCLICYTNNDIVDIYERLK